MTKENAEARPLHELAGMERRNMLPKELRYVMLTEAEIEAGAKAKPHLLRPEPVYDDGGFVERQNRKKSALIAGAIKGFGAKRERKEAVAQERRRRGGHTKKFRADRVKAGLPQLPQQEEIAAVNEIMANYTPSKTALYRRERRKVCPYYQNLLKRNRAARNAERVERHLRERGFDPDIRELMHAETSQTYGAHVNEFDGMQVLDAKMQPRQRPYAAARQARQRRFK